MPHISKRHRAGVDGTHADVNDTSLRKKETPQGPLAGFVELLYTKLWELKELKEDTTPRCFVGGDKGR